MTAPAKPRPIRYVRDRVTDARWVSIGDISRAEAYAEIDRLRAAEKDCSLAQTRDGRLVVRVGWADEPSPNPGRRRSGPTQPESRRAAPQVKLRLAPDTTEALDGLAARWGVTRSAAVARLVEEATR